MRIFSLIIVVMILVGCASYPDLVNVPEGTKLADFTQENKAGVNQLGETARWSGVIASIKNGKTSTTLDVLYYPAQSNGRPKLSDEPIGRFRTKVNKFLDPAVYKKGKSITVLGSVKTKETGIIGEYEYEYPTVGDAKVYLWPKLQEPARVEFYYGWHGYHPSWYWHNGIRHVYIVGQGNHKVPKKQKTKSTN